MDVFEEDSASNGESSSSKLPLIALIIGAVGVVVGITGIILANGASGKVSAIESRLTEIVEALPQDKSPELQSKIDDVENRLVNLGSEFMKQGRTSKSLRDETQAAFTSVSREIAENREEIISIKESVASINDQLASGRVPQSRPASTTSSPVKETSGTDPAAPAADGTYTIQPGDTLSAISQRLGVSINDIYKANPGINPRALQVGQVILLP